MCPFCGASEFSNLLGRLRADPLNLISPRTPCHPLRCTFSKVPFAKKHKTAVKYGAMVFQQDELRCFILFLVSPSVCVCNYSGILLQLVVVVHGIAVQ